jgi:GTP pyrophosphokinase
VARAQSLERFPKLLQHYKVASFDDLAVAVGYGKMQAADAVTFLLPDQKPDETLEPAPELKRARKTARPGKGAASVTVDGIDDVVVRFAKCCSPVPGDPVVGVVTRGRGITVHTRGCHWVLDADPLRRLECSWNTVAGAGATVTVRVYSGNETGLLSAMSARFTEAGIPIQSAHCRTIDGRRAVNDFEVVVSSVVQLNEVIDRLSRLKGVTRVERVRG